MVGIYMYINKLNNKKYIGQSIHITKRKWEHLHQPSATSVFDMHLKLLGEEAFEFVILEECKVEELDEKEKYWIQYYNSINEGYNIQLGGTSKLGENNPFAKLKENQVKQIIKLLECCQLTNKEIAEQFNVSVNSIDLINRCISWKHLHNYSFNIRQENLNQTSTLYTTLNGSRNPSSKINENIAQKIINLLETDERSMAQLSRDYGYSIHIIQDINRCKTWTHLHHYKQNIRKERKNK